MVVENKSRSGHLQMNGRDAPAVGRNRRDTDATVQPVMMSFWEPTRRAKIALCDIPFRGIGSGSELLGSRGITIRLMAACGYHIRVYSHNVEI